MVLPFFPSFVVAYLVWRVMTGRHTSIELNFMVAGHTKFAPDLNFGILKRKLRRTPANCLQDVVAAVNNSSSTNIAFSAGNEDGSNALPQYGWKKFLGLAKPVPDISKLRYLKATSDAPGFILTSEEVPADEAVVLRRSLVLNEVLFFLYHNYFCLYTRIRQ